MPPALSQPPYVVIILLNWNQLQLTLDCLASLEKVTYPNYAIILVDNGSTDGSPEVIQTRYPRLKTITNSQNLGFSEANNVGMRAALADGASYALLLNNDTVVAPDFIERLVEVAESDPSIGIVGSKMYYYDQPEVIWCAGNRIDWRRGTSIRLEADQPDAPQDDRPREVDFITACSVAVKREVIDRIGLMDSRYFIYYDEVDWSLRAARHHFRSVYVPTSRIWHKVSATMGVTSPVTDYYMTRNAFLFLWHNTSGLRRLQLLVVSFFSHLRTILAYSLLPRHRHLQRNRQARLLALRDVLLRRWGKMGADVAAICQRNNA